MDRMDTAGDNVQHQDVRGDARRRRPRRTAARLLVAALGLTLLPLASVPALATTLPGADTTTGSGTATATGTTGSGTTAGTGSSTEDGTGTDPGNSDAAKPAPVFSNPVPDRKSVV